MKYFALASVCLLGVVLGTRAQGPVTQGSESVGKKKTTAADPNATTTPDATDPNAAPIPSKYKPNKDGLPQGAPTFRSDVLTVTVDVAVLDNHGNPIPKIPQERFRILEDNTPQKVTGFSIGEAPMTICLVVEFSNRYQQYGSWTWQETLNDAYYFVRTLKPQDYLAVIAYDMRPEILSDFSVDRTLAQEALSRLRIPAFSESNMYDTLAFTGERMQDIEGRKAIILLSTGIDTFSKLTFDKARRAIQDNGIPIYAIGLAQAQREMAGSRGGMRGAQSDMNLAVSNEQVKTFATETGGRAFFPRFPGEMPGIVQAIHDSLRNNYVLTYQPSNQTKDGKFRRLKVELVNPETNEPLKVVDEKGKPIKVNIIAKAGYKAPREVE